MLSGNDERIRVIVYQDVILLEGRHATISSRDQFINRAVVVKYNMRSLRYPQFLCFFKEFYGFYKNFMVFLRFFFFWKNNIQTNGSETEVESLVLLLK